MCSEMVGCEDWRTKQGQINHCSTLPQLKRYTRSERDKQIDLAIKIAEEGYRPVLRREWNPAIKFLISSCWLHAAKSRPTMAQTMSILSKIISAQGALILSESTTLRIARGEELPKKVDSHLAPGAPWRRVERPPSQVAIGEILGQGSFSTVYKCTFLEEACALKLFRSNTKDKEEFEESAFKEIELMFALRHPNIVGLYGWIRERGEKMDQIGMILELAEGGNLRAFYQGETEQPFIFFIALKIVLGVAKGLAYMHNMPVPVIHRESRAKRDLDVSHLINAKLMIAYSIFG